jgi:hypothetical protein
MPPVHDAVGEVDLGQGVSPHIDSQALSASTATSSSQMSASAATLSPILALTQDQLILS